MRNDNLYLPKDSTVERDVRQVAFFDAFLTPGTTSYLNIHKSAIQAKYSESESDLISTSSWFLQGVGVARRDKIFENSENFLLELSTLDTNDINGLPDAQLLSVKLKGTLAALEGLGKDFYSKRTEENKMVTNLNIFKILNQIEGHSEGMPTQPDITISATPDGS